ncbi:hypothetical protein CV102_09645 [Natronococcus pandeyae]|uniref:DUF7967 domain-containing protein n=1 Tax=Natronococcus pandeyae TaxID=2055836 RepID=A0A8J8TQR2_9EURY|nr:hypothetical protein [Natronococcus pandeyae]TYL38768.1 hypothetical protein CV102_09645 [Natronococcus pandeyae]
MASDDRSGVRSAADDDDGTDGVRVWLVERTYSDDELNLVILVYATEDGRRYHRRERALTSFTGPARETKSSLEVSPDELGTVDDPAERDRYANEASRMAERYEPDDAV